jgi:hypothetical protein
MKTIIHQQIGTKIAEVISDSIAIRVPQDALELLMNLSYQHGVTKFILHQGLVIPDFFNLKTGLAGEVLQKVVNYHLQVAFVGDFSQFKSESFRAFMAESNRGKHVFFFESVDLAKQSLFITNF